jgi:sialidase-1
MSRDQIADISGEGETMSLKLALIALSGLALILPACGPQQPPSLFEETTIFSAGQDHIHTYRIPALICSEKGTLLAFSEGRRTDAADGVPTDIVLKRAMGPAQQGRISWLTMQTVIRSMHGEAYMNPVPLIDRTDGTIYLLLNYYPPPYADQPAEIWLLSSRDEGKTWTAPVNITPGTGKHELGPGDGIQLNSGRLMAPVYDGVVFSDDHGKTWKSGGKAAGEASESQVVELVDGSLLINRRGRPYRLVMKSDNRGQTWSQPKPHFELPDGDCQGSLIRFTREDHGYTKNRLLFANPVAGLDPRTIKDSDPRGRFNITVRLSYDEGKTWSVAKVIRRGPGAYSSMTVLPDGSIGILYETGDSVNGYFAHYQRLIFARFSLEWLTDGKDHLEGTKR